MYLCTLICITYLCISKCNKSQSVTVSSLWSNNFILICATFGALFNFQIWLQSRHTPTRQACLLWLNCIQIMYPMLSLPFVCGRLWNAPSQSSSYTHTHTFTHTYNLVVLQNRRRLLLRKISSRFAFAFPVIRILFNFSEAKWKNEIHKMWTLHLRWRRRRRRRRSRQHQQQRFGIEWI